MSADPLEIASLMCSRLCHDLLSPVGAMNNGLELLADENDAAMRAQVMELLGESAATSASKLRFFRLAFGAAGGFGDVVDTAEAQTAIAGMFGRDKRTEVEWLVATSTLPKPAMKALLNLVLIAGDALVRGGKLVIGSETRGTLTELVVHVEGPRLALDAEVEATLNGERDDAALTARTVPAWLVRHLSVSSGGQAQVLAPEPGVLLFGATLTALP